MFITACFILNIAHALKRSGKQIDDSILKEFFLACFTRTPDWDLCKAVNLFHTNALTKYFYVCDERHPFEDASNSPSFNNL